MGWHSPIHSQSTIDGMKKILKSTGHSILDYALREKNDPTPNDVGGKDGDERTSTNCSHSAFDLSGNAIPTRRMLFFQLRSLIRLIEAYDMPEEFTKSLLTEDLQLFIEDLNERMNRRKRFPLDTSLQADLISLISFLSLRFEEEKERIAKLEEKEGIAKLEENQRLNKILILATIVIIAGLAVLWKYL